MPEIPIKKRASILLSEWSALAPARRSHRRSRFAGNTVTGHHARRQLTKSEPGVPFHQR